MNQLRSTVSGLTSGGRRRQLSIVKLKVQSRNYQSDRGVYGYKKKAEKPAAVPQEIRDLRNQQSNAYAWIQNFRRESHRVAAINPVKFGATEELHGDLRILPAMNYAQFGLSNDQLIELRGLVELSNVTQLTAEQLQAKLTELYCGSVSVEVEHIESETKRDWVTRNFERIRQESVSNAEKKEIAALLIKSQAWDNFLATKFPTVKRYGGEGAESMLAFFRQLFLSSVDADIEAIVLGMPHRGKLNLLTTMLQTRPAKIFRKFKGQPEFPSDAHNVMCDIASHFNSAVDLRYTNKSLRLSMLHNPSHLEAVNPVSMGKARSKQQTSRDGAFSDDAEKPFATSVLNVQLHGDAAFIGQGINQEMLIMAGTPQFDVGGTIHMIVNNQVGFTTPGQRGRSCRYTSDLAKCINAPIFHVNVDDPEGLALITKLAFEYQREFREDVFIDLNCFRRWGHNELDDPTFTNPLLYKVIHGRKSVPDTYAEKLIKEGVMSQPEVDLIAKGHHNYLQNELNNLESYVPERSYFERQWTGIEKAKDRITTWDTGLDPSLLGFIGQSSLFYPEDFNIHPHLHKIHVTAKTRKILAGDIDWATAEAMAIGSLLYQGHNVRLSGEDVGRGTFSHRHIMLVDQETNEMFIPLNSMKGGLSGKVEVANSVLSEEAVLGFEYGMAIDNPNNLIIWEAQFGDFFNGAQIIIDTFIASGETKWMTSNGMVMLLPHGYDGAASEHSSCRMERFLQMTDSKEASPDGDDINMQVINPTTPAQYFHALRRQMVRNFRKPLVVVAPKILLRLSEANSSWEDFKEGTHFQPIIGDRQVNAGDVKKVILCSGKHYYALKNERKTRGLNDVAIIRIESLCPFPVNEINEELSKYTNAKVFIWSQEEHRNMGAWSFIKPRFENMCGKKIKYSGRYEAATPAVGVSSWHHKEVQFVVQDPFNQN